MDGALSTSHEWSLGIYKESIHLSNIEQLYSLSTSITCRVYCVSRLQLTTELDLQRRTAFFQVNSFQTVFYFFFKISSVRKFFSWLFFSNGFSFLKTSNGRKIRIRNKSKAKDVCTSLGYSMVAYTIHLVINNGYVQRLCRITTEFQ